MLILVNIAVLLRQVYGMFAGKKKPVLPYLSALENAWVFKGALYVQVYFTLLLYFHL